MRYIDADALIKKIFPYDVVDKKYYAINAGAVADAIDNAPTADVVPKSEVEELIRENESLAKTVNEASDLIRKLQNKLKKSESEVAREIFEEIEELAKIYTFPVVKNGVIEIVKEPFWCIEPNDLAELKKKHIGEEI